MWSQRNPAPIQTPRGGGRKRAPAQIDRLEARRTTEPVADHKASLLGRGVDEPHVRRPAPTRLDRRHCDGGIVDLEQSRAVGER